MIDVLCELLSGPVIGPHYWAAAKSRALRWRGSIHFYPFLQREQSNAQKLELDSGALDKWQQKRVRHRGRLSHNLSWKTCSFLHLQTRSTLTHTHTHTHSHRGGVFTSFAYTLTTLTLPTAARSYLPSSPLLSHTHSQRHAHLQDWGLGNLN